MEEERFHPCAPWKKASSRGPMSLARARSAGHVRYFGNETKRSVLDLALERLVAGEGDHPVVLAPDQQRWKIDAVQPIAAVADCATAGSRQGARDRCGSAARCRCRAWPAPLATLRRAWGRGTGGGRIPPAPRRRCRRSTRRGLSTPAGASSVSEASRCVLRIAISAATQPPRQWPTRCTSRNSIACSRSR